MVNKIKIIVVKININFIKFEDRVIIYKLDIIFR
jgi:hypothetical protein